MRLPCLSQHGSTNRHGLDLDVHAPVATPCTENPSLLHIYIYIYVYLCNYVYIYIYIHNTQSTYIIYTYTHNCHIYHGI